MSERKGKSAIVWLLLAAAAFLLLRGLLGLVLSLPAPCTREPAPGAAPLALTFELRASEARAGRTPRLWYRAVVENATCDAVSFDPDFFEHGKRSEASHQLGLGFHFRVSDPHGKESPILPAAFHSATKLVLLSTAAPSAVVTARPYRDARSPEETRFPGVEPYIIDAGSYQDNERRKTGGLLELQPGETLLAFPTRYWPHKLEIRDYATETHIMSGSARVPVQTAQPIAELPPEGFRLLDELVFRQTGAYRVRLAYKGDLFVRRRFRVGGALRRLGLSLGVAPSEHARLEIDVESAPAKLEVAR